MVSSFSTPGFPHVHAHPTRLPTMDARLPAAIDSLVASMRADLRAIRDSNLALCKAVDSTVAPIRRNLALLHHDLAFGVEGDFDPASMCSKQAESIEVGHQKPHDGDGSPLRISSVISIDSVPPLLSSSPFLRAMAISPVKAHLNDLLASTIPSNVQGLVFPLRNAGTTKTAVPSPLADQHISDSINLEEYGDYMSFNSQIIHLCMLPSMHTNTTKHRHEVLRSLIYKLSHGKAKWHWFLNSLLACYTDGKVGMNDVYLNEINGWVGMYEVGKFVLVLNAEKVFDEMPTRECENIRGTYFEFIFSLRDHREITFGALAIDLHADFSVLFPSNLNFRPVWDPGDALAQAVKLMLYLQCNEGKRMGKKQSCFCLRQCSGDWQHAAMLSLVSWVVVRRVETWETPHAYQYKLQNDNREKHKDNLFDVQRLLHLLAVSRNIRGALLYEIERYKKKALVEQLGCLAIQLHCSDLNLETNNEENWSKEHNGANITVAMFLIVGTNVPIVQESFIPQYMAELARHVIMFSSLPTFPVITGKSYNNTKLDLKEKMLELRADRISFEVKKVAPDTPKGLGCIARGDEGLVQFHWLNHRLKLVKKNYELPTLYTIDWRDIEFRISEGVDLIAMSVVKIAESVKRLKNHLFTKSAKSIRVFAKVADVSEAVRQYAFNIVRSISIVESLVDAFSQQWFSVKLIYALCCLLIIILGIVGMHHVVHLVGGSKEPIKSMATIESIALVLAYFTNKRMITLLLYYGGRIGYEKVYCERLLGKWEVVDVNDCCSCALYLVDFGKIYALHLYNTKYFQVEGSSTVSSRKPVIFADKTCAIQTAALGNANFAPVFVQGSLNSVCNRYQLLMWVVVYTADEDLESITDTQTELQLMELDAHNFVKFKVQNSHYPNGKLQKESKFFFFLTLRTRLFFKGGIMI